MVELNREYLVEKYRQCNLINLTSIDISHNKIRKIDSNTFKGFDKLEELWLDHNEIEEIKVKSFESLSSLNSLRLVNNKLKEIDSETFKGLTKLEKLSLSNNEIEEIGVRSFESLSNLKLIRLDKNKLKEIDRKCFEPLKSIEVIEIYENFGLHLQKVQIYQKQSKTKERRAIQIQYPYIGLFLNDRYKVERKLGKGTFGLVYLVDDMLFIRMLEKECSVRITSQELFTELLKL